MVLKIVFYWILFSSAAASILAAAVILVKLILKNRISSRLYSLLWLLVVIRLITAPFAPESPVSVLNLLNHSGAGINNEQIVQNTLPAWNNLVGDAYPGTGAVEPYDQNSPKLSDNARETDQENRGVSTARSDMFLVLASLWFAGLMLVACTMVYSGAAFSKGLKNAAKIPDDRLPSSITVCRRRLGIKESIEIYSSSRIASPCINGIIKPRVYLPEQILLLVDRQQLTHVLMHEFAHIKRKDYLVNVLIVAVSALHWFNPVLWYAMKQLNLEREMACDACALELLGLEEAVPYGMTLINFSRMMPQGRLRFSPISYYKSKKQIERRIVMIKKFKKGSYRVSAAAIIMCLIVGMPVLTNAAGSGSALNAAAAAVQNGALQISADQNTGKESGDDQIKALLGHQDYQYFNSLDRALEFVSFGFKAPNYVPQGFELYNVMLHRERVDNNDLLTINYWATTDGGKMVSSNEEHHFSLMISKGDLLKSAESDKTASYKEEKMKFGTLNAVSLTINRKEEIKAHGNQVEATYGSRFVTDTVKELIWQANGTWYKLEYYVSTAGPDGKPVVYDSLSTEELGKITASMTSPKDAKNVNYESGIFKNSFEIYGKEDLRAAEEILGFAPKFPLGLAEGYNACKARLSTAVYFPGSDKDTPMFSAEYRTANSGANDKDVPTIEISQGTLSSLYDSVAENSYVSEWNAEKQQDEKLPSKEVKIAGMKVYVYSSPSAGTMNYIWEQNGIYYTAAFSKDIDNQEEIIKNFMTQTF